MSYWSDVEPQKPSIRNIVRQGDNGKGYFTEYNKETKKEEEVTFDELIVLKKMLRIGGYDQAKESYMYSNEVSHFGKTFKVKYNKTNESIAEGPWKDIKEKLPSGYDLYYVIVCLDMNSGDLVKLSLKGKSYFHMSELIGKTMKIQENRIKFKEVVHGKKGKIEWEEVVFETGAELNEGDIELAMKHEKILREYDEYMEKKYAKEGEGELERADEASAIVDEVNTEVRPEYEDELPF